jgi:hypothetical protein
VPDIKLVIVVILFARHASMPVVKVLGAKDKGEESSRLSAKTLPMSFAISMPAEPGPRRFGPDAARGGAPVASTCGDLHVAGSRPHA